MGREAKKSALLLNSIRPAGLSIVSVICLGLAESRHTCLQAMPAIFILSGIVSLCLERFSIPRMPIATASLAGSVLAYLFVPGGAASLLLGFFLMTSLAVLFMETDTDRPSLPLNMLVFLLVLLTVPHLLKISGSVILLAGLSLLALLLIGIPGKKEGGIKQGEYVLAIAPLFFAGVISVKLHQELICFTDGSLFSCERTWAILLFFLAAGAFLISWPGPRKEMGFILLFIAPFAIQYTAQRLDSLSWLISCLKSLNAISMLTGGTVEPFNALDPDAGRFVAAEPSGPVLWLLVASISMLPMLMLGGALGGFTGGLRGFPRAGFMAAFFSGGVLFSRFFTWKAAAFGLPFSGLLLWGFNKARMREKTRPGWGIACAALACLTLFLQFKEPRLLAPLASSGAKKERESWAGRLTLLEGSRAAFLDGLPLFPRSPCFEFFSDLEPSKGECIAYTLPYKEMAPPWKSVSFLKGTWNPEEDLPRYAGSIAVMVPDFRHRASKVLFSGDFLSLIGKRAERVFFLLDPASIDKDAFHSILRKFTSVFKDANIYVCMKRLLHPLLVLASPGGKEKLSRNVFLAAGNEKVQAFSGKSPPPLLDPWVLRPRGVRVSPNQRICPILRELSEKRPKEGNARQGVLLILKALSLRWEKTLPLDPMKIDPERALVPAKGELEVITKALEKDPIPLVLDYIEMVGDHMLSPRIQLLERARPFFEKWAKLLPGNGAVQRLLGTLMVRLLEHEKAIPHLEKALELDPGNRKTLRELGLALFGTKRFRAAAARLKFLHPDPARDLEAARALGLSLFHVNDPEAKGILEKVKALDPWDEEVKKAARALGIKDAPGAKIKK